MQADTLTHELRPSPGSKWLVVVVATLGVTLLVFSMGHMSVLKVQVLSADRSTVHELAQLSVATEAFRLKYGLYPPSTILLSNDPDTYKDDPKSLAELRRIWPRLQLDGNVDWSGGIAGFKSARLEGDQCLVYFLQGPAGQGFSRDPRNPCLKPTEANEMRAGPFFAFVGYRLVKRPGNPFPSYQDPCGKNVYAFFSSHGGAYTDDCPALKVQPYYRWDGQRRYYNPSTVQIISAGPDGVFGPGGSWAPETAAKDAGPHGKDDLCNFHGTFLGREE